MSETYIFGNVGQTNAQIGTNTMLNTTGAGNSAFGNNVFTYLTSGVNNSGFGVEVASGLPFNGSNNTAYGVEVMKVATSASDTSGFGYQALTALTSGNNNTGFGLLAGSTATTAANNTIVGANAGTVSPTTTNALVVGVNAVGADTSIVVGANAKCLATAVGSNNIVVGAKARVGEGSTNSILISTAGGGGSINGAGSYGNITDTVGIGAGILAYQTPAVCANNLLVGSETGSEITYLSNSVYMGLVTGGGMQGDRNVALGYQTFADDSVSYDNVGLGYNCGQAAYGNDNVLAGYSCGQELRGGVGCTGIGGFCMYQVSSFTSTSVNPSSILQSALTGTGGFADPIGSLGTFVYRLQTVIPGATSGVAPGTAIGINGIYAVFETQAGGVGAVSKFLITVSTSATTAFLDGKYFFIASPTVNYYVWYNIDNLTPDPALVGKTGIEVNLTSGESPSNIVYYTYNTIRYVGGYKAIFIDPNYSPNQGFLLVNTGVGNVTDIAPGTAVGFGKITTVSKVRDGTGSEGELNYIEATMPDLTTVAGTYFLISSATTDYYVWFNDGFQTDPMIVGRTGIQVSYTIAEYNTASGWSAMRTDTTGGGATPKFVTESTSLGYRAMEELNTGSHYNTIIGAQSVTANTTYTEVTTLGAGSDVTTDQATSVGATSSAAGTSIGYGASSASTNSLGLGNAAAGSANEFQIGQNAVSGAATMNFRTQIVADESWIGGGSSSVIIDNNGNVVRGTDSIISSSTTNATPTTMETYTMADNTTREVEALVMGTRTGGKVGNTADTYSVRLDASIKRTGLLVTINKVTEIHLQDTLKSFIITNLVTGNTRDLEFGTALGANRLQSYGTITQGSLVKSEVSIVDFQNFVWFAFAFTTYYLTFSSPTTDYYVWWNNTVFNANTNPALPGRTGIKVDYTFENDLALATLTQAAITSTALDITTVITSSLLRLTSVANGDAQDIEGGTAALGNAGELTGVATALQGIPGTQKEVSLVDFTGATGAGLAGKYFTLNSPTTNYYVWFNTGISTNPGGAGTPLAGRLGIMINVLAGDTGPTLCSKTFTTLNGLPAFTAQITPFVPTTAMRMENISTGSVSDITPSSPNMLFPNTLSGLNYVTVLRQGASAAVAEVSAIDASNATPAGLAGTYFFLSSPTTNYYLWYRVDGVTPDPLAVGTSIVVDILTGDTDIVIATKTAAVISAIGGGTVFTSAVQSPWVIDIVASGTNAILQVTGSVATNITWKGYTRNFAV